jgi:hypothetical protein
MRKRIVAIVCMLTCCCFAAQTGGDLSTLLSRFESERSIEKKEAIIFDVSEHHPEAGPQLLRIAESTSDIDTRWLAIRYLGHLKYEPATEFLLGCLSSPHHYVRANAARALGDIRASKSEEALIKLLKTDEDDGVIQQTALALEMLKAVKAVPVLKLRADEVRDAQTECWLIGAIAVLGSRTDVPFVAKRLYDHQVIVGYCAAEALQQLVGENLHLGIHEGPGNLSEPIAIAKEWWAKNAAKWDSKADNH